MANLLRVSEAASLGLHTMAYLTLKPGQRIGTQEVAKFFGASAHHLAKVFQRLVKSGLVASTRGPHGGFVLAKKPEEITLLDIYEAVEGRIGDPECLLGRRVCKSGCILGGHMEKLHNQMREYLKATSLTQISTLVKIDI